MCFILFGEKKMFFAHVKTVALLTILTLILLAIGGVIGGTTGLTVAFAFAMLINFFSYWYSDKIVLAIYRAKEISKKDSPTLHTIVEEVAEKASLPKPKVCLVNSNNPNAL